LSRKPKLKPWKGPLPRRRATPAPVLGEFLEHAIMREAGNVERSPSPVVAAELRHLPAEGATPAAPWILSRPLTREVSGSHGGVIGGPRSEVGQFGQGNYDLPKATLRLDLPRSCLRDRRTLLIARRSARAGLELQCTYGAEPVQRAPRPSARATLELLVRAGGRHGRARTVVLELLSMYGACAMPHRQGEQSVKLDRVHRSKLRRPRQSSLR
jgi:hypothetical protein